MSPTIWPHLRALLVTAHIVAVLVCAFPSPSGGMNRSTWKNPTVQAEMSAWAQRLSMDPEILEDHLWEMAKRYMAARKGVLAPFAAYYEHAGTYQAWHMFIAPHRNPARLYIDLSEDGDQGESWRLLYISRHPELRWRAELFDHSRSRAALFRYSWSHYRSPYRKFGKWLAAEAAAEFPAASQLRLRWLRYQTPSPEQVLTSSEPEGTFERPMLFKLEAYR